MCWQFILGCILATLLGVSLLGTWIYYIIKDKGIREASFGIITGGFAGCILFGIAYLFHYLFTAC